MDCHYKRVSIDAKFYKFYHFVKGFALLQLTAVEGAGVKREFGSTIPPLLAVDSVGIDSSIFTCWSSKKGRDPACSVVSDLVSSFIPVGLWTPVENKPSEIAQYRKSYVLHLWHTRATYQDGSEIS